MSAKNSGDRTIMGKIQEFIKKNKVKVAAIIAVFLSVLAGEVTGYMPVISKLMQAVATTSQPS